MLGNTELGTGGQKDQSLIKANVQSAVCAISSVPRDVSNRPRTGILKLIYSIVRGVASVLGNVHQRLKPLLW